ncbi:G2/mitotic-specific cyclin-4 [Penicillium macrosclerotiorum]|uniref:G2/mitotic-specific cyclin-4 n=1 Tax=Penicillium macrosclerotiorum TaxID=303699 RepID=UPI0025486BB3|nr:G2/mitotic-specific cyclin-4 [Penicillium macrosclerotiorum]KAJ5690586.1 G2/mitotic-specific cyclin-4 [Penicillium macrosclerotiorum]
MDAKPQRIRVRGDENVPPSLHATKAIHQRNKSTPALNLAAQGAKNGARRAFGDVSNVKTIRDDSVLPGKPAAQADYNKPALSQPAQRPMSVSGIKGLLSNVTAKPVNPAGKAQPAARTTKRNNVVFRDQLEPVVEKAPSKEVITTQAVRCEERPAEAPVSKNVDKDESESEQEYFDTLPEESAAVVEASNAGFSNWREMLPQLSEPSKAPSSAPALEKPRALPAPPHRASLPEVHPEYQRRDTTGPAVSECEEWEDEESARGYPSRTDNTTGGTTTVIYPKTTAVTKRELQQAKTIVEASQTEEEIMEDFYDASMVAEYSNEIFLHLRTKEIAMLPVADYMANQAEIQWSMRSVLMDWLVQVHFRFALLPETLFLCVNYIDRFLSHKIVSLGKLQLVGATAIFIAAKYEEITAPSVGEIFYMVDGGYTVDEILKAERFMLNILNFDLGWPGPMSFLRRISKADDYDLETRTVAKYFLELTIMDERFVSTPPSFAAAGAHCLARLMLQKGCWTPAHAFYSGYLYDQLIPVMSTMLECCEDPQRHHQAIYEKYSDRRFKRASLYVEAEMKRGFNLSRPTNLKNADRLDGLANY